MLKRFRREDINQRQALDMEFHSKNTKPAKILQIRLSEVVEKEKDRKM